MDKPFLEQWWKWIIESDLLCSETKRALTQAKVNKEHQVFFCSDGIYSSSSIYAEQALQHGFIHKKHYRSNDKSCKRYAFIASKPNRVPVFPLI